MAKGKNHVGPGASEKGASHQSKAGGFQSSIANELLKGHADLKRIRGRGEQIQNQLSMVVYLSRLEDELERIKVQLNEAWISFDELKDFRRCQRHADHAQQRLHRVIKKLKKKV